MRAWWQEGGSWDSWGRDAFRATKDPFPQASTGPALTEVSQLWVAGRISQMVHLCLLLKPAGRGLPKKQQALSIPDVPVSYLSPNWAIVPISDTTVRVKELLQCFSACGRRSLWGSTFPLQRSPKIIGKLRYLQYD